MKTLATVMTAATLLALAACAKPDDGAANIVIENTAGDVESVGNDTTFASDNVLLPQQNSTDLDVAEPANGADRADNTN